MTYHMANDGPATLLDEIKACADCGNFNVWLDATTATPCTAIPSIEGELNPADRQNAFVLRTTMESGEMVEGVVFGYEMPTSRDELAELWETLANDPYAYDTDWETLETVIYEEPLKGHSFTDRLASAQRTAAAQNVDRAEPSLAQTQTR